MQPDVALNEEYSDLYPFSEIVGNANILIMPGQHSAAISYKIMKALGGAKVIGPLLIGLGQPIEIALEVINIRYTEFSLSCCIFSWRNKI